MSEIQIKMFVFDIDGVITDGKRYLCGDTEIKGLSMKDLDAIRQIKELGIIVGCISGEDTQFSQQFVQIAPLDWAQIGCKAKEIALEEAATRYGFSLDQVCYTGDGKYDVQALRIAGMSVCPADAIEVVRDVADVILTRKGGEGCIAEIYSLLSKFNCWQSNATRNEWNDVLMQRMNEHLSVLNQMMEREDLLSPILDAVSVIVDCYGRRGKLLLCGNGGSAADAQHLAGELVGRFYLERRALDAQALTTNTSILTSLANDYNYEMIFARQVEAQASRGDVLIGITTSGTSKNIRQTFQKAKEIGVKTILMTGDIARDAEILQDTDCLLAVPAKDTPRIQEMHIMIGHIICELVEREIADNLKFN